ncbi:hypothetical protein DFH11DRAFT_1637523 [Phellopilus nigrolimitatus]|nr:hypothetical protein DFH11DRAFT_1637523 [Phellopilus nigrolimitatus]
MDRIPRAIDLRPVLFALRDELDVPSLFPRKFDYMKWDVRVPVFLDKSKLGHCFSFVVFLILSFAFAVWGVDELMQKKTWAVSWIYTRPRAPLCTPSDRIQHGKFPDENSGNHLGGYFGALHPWRAACKLGFPAFPTLRSSGANRNVSKCAMHTSFFSLVLSFMGL